MRSLLRDIGIAAAAMCFTCHPGTAAAQDGRLYLSAAFTSAPWSPKEVYGGSASTLYENSSTETRVVGLVGEVGWFLMPSVAIGVELGGPLRRNNLTQDYGYLFGPPYTRHARYRDLTLLAVLRGQVLARERIRIELVGSGGPLFASSLDRFSDYIRVGDAYVHGPFGQETEQSHMILALGGGADLAFSAAPHVQIVPQFRLFVVARGDVETQRVNPLGGGFADLGLNRVVYRIGIGVRSSF